MNKVWKVLAGIALVAILVFQQLELAVMHDEVQSTKEDIEVIKAYIIKTHERMNYTKAEEECLARNVFYEAGIEDRLGKFAVAQVTLNRLKEGRWGKNICSVVYAKSQFSWTLDRKKRNTQPKGELWEASKAVAHQVLAKGYRVNGLETSTYYHADYVQPLWRKSVVKIQQVGRHIFYTKA